MGIYKANTHAGRHITLNSLKEQLYSLNMRLRLAMQYHDEESKTEIMRQIIETQQEIERMSLGGSH